MTDAFAAGHLLRAWFAETRERPETIATRMPWWFGADPERDRDLSARFGAACQAACAGELQAPEDDARGQLGLILLTDQLPRNLYRGTSQAFAHDRTSLALCLKGHDGGLDKGLTLIERVFYWMPLQHAEDIETQQLSVRLFGSLAGEDPARDGLWSGIADYAQLHHDIVARFGRFPHRNAVLNRPSSPDEIAYLAEAGERFGQ